MLNEILNKREDREVWRIKEQIEIGKLKRVMHDRLPCVRLRLSLYVRNKNGSSAWQQLVQANVENPHHNLHMVTVQNKKGNGKHKFAPTLG